jgi:hypothetical protein
LEEDSTIRPLEGRRLDHILSIAPTELFLLSIILCY